MRKVNVKVEAIMLVPVKVTLDVLIRADDDANLTKVIEGFAKGVQHSAKADVEDYTVEEATFAPCDSLDDSALEKTVASAVAEYHLTDKPVKLEKIICSQVTDSR